MDGRSAYPFVKAAAQMRNMSKAAAALNVSQPAISAQIHKAEKIYRIEIFDRAVKPLTLTEEGKAYLQYCEKSEDLEREFRRHLSDVQGLRTGDLTIGGPTLFNSTYLPPVVAAFNQKYPGVNVRIVDRPVPELAQMTLAGEIDLFVSPNEPVSQDLSSMKIRENRVILVVPAAWEINRQLEAYQLPPEEIVRGVFDREIVDLARFDGCPFILLREDQNIGTLFRRLIAESGVKPGTVIYADQILTSYSFSAAGAGISLAASPIVGIFGSDRLTYYLAGSEITKRQLYICWQKQQTLSAAGSVFLQMMKGDTSV